MKTIFVFLFLAGLFNIAIAQQAESADAEKETIKKVVTTETKGYATKDYDLWKNQWAPSEDVLAIFVGSGYYNEIHGFEKLSGWMKSVIQANPEPRKDLFSQENFIIRLGEKVAHASYDQYITSNANTDTTHSRELRTLVKQDGQWKIIEMTAIYDDGFKASLVAVENDLNMAGYKLLELDKFDDAIALFKLNVHMFPDSWNVWDSLGEAYARNGDKEAAIENYKTSLELKPENENAKKMLIKLENEPLR